MQSNTVVQVQATPPDLGTVADSTASVRVTGAKPSGMNVCMISYSIYESDNRVLRYAETLAKRGDHVDVLALSLDDSPPTEVINGVHVFRIQNRARREKTKLSYLIRILTFLFRSMFFFMSRNSKAEYDLVHVHSVPDFMVFAAWLPKKRGAKIILDIHDVLPEFYISKFGARTGSLVFRLLLKVEKLSAAFADHVIIANDIWREKLVQRSVHPEKCSAILNFPDRAIFFRRGKTRTDGRFVITYPGTLNWHQGVDIAIRAFARIKDVVPNAEFHIYGTGPGQEFLIALAHELGLNGRVKFLGARKLRDIAIEIENADMGVVPKRSDSFGNEAFSTKILEFMALGVPVIVADTKIDRYYFNDDVVKFFRSGDEKSMSEAMLAVIRDAHQRQNLILNASKFVETFDWDYRKSIYFDVIENLLNKRSKS